MLSNGRVVKCSRTENRELFSLAPGGYGLFGVILDVKLRVMENEIYQVERHVVPLEDALTTFDRKFRGRGEIQLVYAHLNIARGSFLEDVILYGYRRESGVNTQTT